MNNQQNINEFTIPRGEIAKRIGGFFRGLFRSTSDDVIQDVSNRLGSLMTKLAKNSTVAGATKQLELSVIRGSSEYKASLDILAENLSRTTYNKSFKALTDAEKNAIVKQTTTKLDEVITNQLKSLQQKMGEYVGKTKVTGKYNQIAQNSIPRIQQELAALSKQNKTQVNKLIQDNLVSITTSKTNVEQALKRIKSGKITVFKNGKMFDIATNSVKNKPIKIMQLNSKTIKIIAGIGASAGAISYLISTMYPNDEVVVIDENGNDITSGSTTSGSRLQYKNCTDFPFEFGCINPKIAEMQQKLGVTPAKGYFGPITRRALGGANTITLDMYNNTMNSGASSGPNLKASDMPGYKKEFKLQNKQNIQTPSYLNYNEPAQQPENPNKTYRASI